MSNTIKWALAIAIATASLGVAASSATAVGYGKQPNPVTVSAERGFYKQDARILIDRLQAAPAPIEPKLVLPKPAGRDGSDLKRMDDALLAFLKLDEKTFRDKMNAGNSLLDIAEEQGLTRQQLTDFMTKQFQSELNRAAAEGFIPQGELQKIPEFFPGLADRLVEFQLGTKSYGFEAQRQDLNTLLDLLKLDEPTFRDKIVSGQSLAEIAQAQGVSRQQLKDLMTKQNNDQLAQAVEDGFLTQNEADRIKETFAAQLDKILDEKAQDHPRQGKLFLKKPAVDLKFTTDKLL